MQDLVFMVRDIGDMRSVYSPICFEFFFFAFRSLIPSKYYKRAQLEDGEKKNIEHQNTKFNVISISNLVHGLDLKNQRKRVLTFFWV